MKKSIKVVISLMLAIATLFLMSTVAFAANDFPSAYYPKSHLDFKDVNKGDWYYDAVNYVSNGYMSGYGGEKAGLFGPADLLQRQDMAVLLYRYACLSDKNSNALPSNYGKMTKPASLGFLATPSTYNYEVMPWINSRGQFVDVYSNAYYTQPINILRYKGIVSGYSNGRFGVCDYITREQFITMIYRYEGSPNKYGNFSNEEFNKFYKFSDSNLVSSFAKDAMVWGINAGIITGKTKTFGNPFNKYIAPQDNLSRAEAATILMRLDWYHKYALPYGVG